LAALPIGWHLKERHDASEEAKRVHAQLLDAQSQYAAARSNLERLRADSQRLELSLIRANETAMRAAEFAKAFDVWKKRIRTLLTSDDYRWSDESPFVRISKSSLAELAELSFGEPFSTAGTIQPSARELLGLTPGECQVVEETLHRHFTDVNARMAAGIIETNKPLTGREVAGRVFVVPEFGDEAKEREQQTLAELREILGEERWPQVQARLDPPVRNTVDFERILRDEVTHSLSVWVGTDDRGTPTMGFSNSGGLVTGGTKPLSIFLPEGDPNRTDGAGDFGRGFMSEALRQRALTWLQEQAIARLGKEAKP